jgi:hypothetical protein
VLEIEDDGEMEEENDGATVGSFFRNGRRE